MELGARNFLIKSRSLAGVVPDEDIPPVQITFIGQLRLTPIRDITAAEVNRMLLVPGIVISAARTRPKATTLHLKCKSCHTDRRIPCPPDGAQLPFTCAGNKASEENGGNPPPEGGGPACQQNPYAIIPDKCTFVDVQQLKLQEAPETVPTGEMPRTVQVNVDRVYADRIAPGTRVRFLAIAAMSSAARGAAAGVRVPYLRAVGVVSDEEGGGRNAITTFTPEEEARLKALAADPDVFSRLAASVAPSIAGDYTDDIKKAILCMLLGGRWKKLPDGGRLRGDINVLMLGDPSTAKSQFLKFVERVAPVGVYTSGKGSSAAGLTASVIKDQRGEFHLEGGAMVLADGGVVCIDEFDKMREEDRVAIHEVRAPILSAPRPPPLPPPAHSFRAPLPPPPPSHARRPWSSKRFPLQRRASPPSSTPAARCSPPPTPCTAATTTQKASRTTLTCCPPSSHASTSCSSCETRGTRSATA
jgi:DNA replication licensing factor MCM5